MQFIALSQAVGLRTTAEKCRPLGSTFASMLLAAGVQASAGHPFAHATFYQEGFF
jgi:isopentenyl phosphate kinase